VQAGILEDRPGDSGVRAALLTDPQLTERQKQVLIEIYESFRKESQPTAPTAEVVAIVRERPAPAAGTPAADSADSAGAGADTPPSDTPPSDTQAPAAGRGGWADVTDPV
jgi:hypothetical protein